MTSSPQTIGLLQLFDSSLAMLDLPRFGGHPYLIICALFLSVIFVAIGAWNLAE